MLIYILDISMSRVTALIASEKVSHRNLACLQVVGLPALPSVGSALSKVGRESEFHLLCRSPEAIQEPSQLFSSRSRR